MSNHLVGVTEIAEMLEALSDIRDRALWACAFHAGLRFGELRALRWEHVDLAEGRLHVRESMDDKKAITAPKTRAGVRTLPITLHLRKPVKPVTVARIFQAVFWTIRWVGLP